MQRSVFMPINQESMWQISMHKFANMYPKTYFQKAVSGVKSSSGVIREDQIKLCFKQFSLLGKDFFIEFNYSRIQSITGFWYCFVFWKQCLCWAIKNQIFSCDSILLSVRKMSWRIVQRLLQINAKMNRQGGHSFTAQTGTFLSQE